MANRCLNTHKNIANPAHTNPAFATPAHRKPCLTKPVLRLGEGPDPSA